MHAEFKSAQLAVMAEQVRQQQAGAVAPVCGYLMMYRQVGKDGKRWTRRYCRLTQRFLEYGASPGSLDRSAVVQTGKASSRPDALPGQFSLILDGPDSASVTTVHLRAETRQEASRWLAHVAAPHTAASASASNTAVSSRAYTSVSSVGTPLREARRESEIWPKDAPPASSSPPSPRSGATSSSTAARRTRQRQRRARPSARGSTGSGRRAASAASPHADTVPEATLSALRDYASGTGQDDPQFAPWLSFRQGQHVRILSKSDPPFRPDIWFAEVDLVRGYVWADCFRAVVQSRARSSASGGSIASLSSHGSRSSQSYSYYSSSSNDDDDDDDDNDDDDD